MVDIPLPKGKYWLYFLEQNLYGKISQLYNTKMVGSLLSDSIKTLTLIRVILRYGKKMIPQLKINYLPVPIYPILKGSFNYKTI